MHINEAAHLARTYQCEKHGNRCKEDQRIRCDEFFRQLRANRNRPLIERGPKS